MDTCSKLGKPRGVEWKDIIRSFTRDYKRKAVELVVSSGRSITSVAKELGLRDSVVRRWVDKFRQEPTSWRPTTQATPMSADQGFRDRSVAPRERTAAHI